MARLSDADQSQLPLPRLDPGRTDRVGPGAVDGLGKAQLRAERDGYPGMAELVLQVPDDGSGTLSRARFVHPDDEDEEHAATPPRRRTHHALGAGVLRLGSSQ